MTRGTGQQTPKQRSLDWPGLMRAGLGQLRLMPDQFWALTPVELALMLGHFGSEKPMNRNRLKDLLQSYPDGGSPRASGQRQE
ncbi:rcc01693 family protein [Thalassovita sp.]|uniref:rcc01693 family protein n=1 Tax=Thalassovita sp. TaxID=1979401 RepID=UPI002AB1C84B|nr:rcc01693 family protein [Thalassovita sp.]